METAQRVIIGIILIILIAMLGLWIVSSLQVSWNKVTIRTFEECIAAGNPAMESYPRQCRTKEGVLFVEQIPGTNPDPAATTTPTGSVGQNPGALSTVVAKIDQGASALGVKIIPLELIEDSRCPINAVCIQAGTVRVKVLIMSGMGDSNMTVRLGVPITTEGEEVTLTEVQPAPIAGQTASPHQYSFTFTIRKR